MKKIYLITMLFSFIFLSGCSKDFLKAYDERIIGRWRISDVDRFGFGGSMDRLPFRNGYFTFNHDGSLSYTTPAGETYTGTWSIEKKWREDKKLQSLHITVVDFTTQQLKSEYYDDINFRSTNHFKANISSGFHTYVTHFRR